MTTFAYYFGLSLSAGEENEVPTVVAPIADRIIREEGTPEVIDLSAVFSDPGDSLTFSLPGQPPSWATIDGSELTLAPASGDIENDEGSQTITVRATDDGSPGLWAEDSFFVTVLPEQDGSIPTELRNITVWPAGVWPTKVWPAAGPHRDVSTN